MSLATCGIDRWAVVDLETTGFSRYDRVVEVGIVSLDRDGEVVDEYVTLLDPDRDIGATHVHGITASMTQDAPRFSDVAGTIAGFLDGAALVAHNAAFDARFLAQEYERLGVDIEAASPVCTMRLGMANSGSGGRLVDLCREFEIPLEDCHSALHDARAAAQLLRRIATREPLSIPDDCSVSVRDTGGLEASPRTVRRDRFVDVDDETAPYLTRLTNRLPSRPHEATVETYLRVLDDALADLVFTDDETDLLDEVADIAGLDRQRRSRAHAEYFGELVEAAVRDGVVTDEELEVLQHVAELLGQDPQTLEQELAAYRPDPVTRPDFAADTRVCFTGDAGFDENGAPWTRDRLHELAAAAGLVPVGSVTKKGCDLLVAADPASRSGKAKKARRYDIPIVSVDEFLTVADGDGTWAARAAT